MPTPTRTGRASSAARTRTATSRGGRFARSTATPRRTSPTQGLRRRRQPQPSGMKKVLGAMLPTGAAKKAAPSSKKGRAGGLALVAAAAGVMFKNREKLTEQLRHRNSGSAPDTTPTGVNNTAGTTTPPGTPTV